MRVLVAYEFSGIVRENFREIGHNAWSCDLLETEIPGQHYICDIHYLLDNDMDWDLLIAHPPCTALCVSGNRYYSGTELRDRALDEIRWLMGLDIPKICIENPVGVISTHIRKPDQYIQPWMFGEDASKKTGLWLKNLPLLHPTEIIKKERYANQTPSGQNNLSPAEDRWRERSRTYEGIARAMAEQWG